jgi:hypothetical protein
MFTFRLASAIVGLLLLAACGSSPTASPVASPGNPATSEKFALVGGGAVIGMDGKVIGRFPGGGPGAVGVGTQHAVGAYLIQSTTGSGKGWTIDASGAVKDVAPAAIAILAPSGQGGWTPPLIVDSTTAVTVKVDNGGLTAEAVDLSTGAVRPLLAQVPFTGVMSLQALTVLDVSPDRKTVWLSKITSTGGISGRLEILGVDLVSGKVISQGLANALAGAEIAISRDGKTVAGQEEAGTDSANLAIRHLHVVTLASGVDKDVQGTASYVGGQATPSVLFAPGGKSVVWWGGLNNGSLGDRINVATIGGHGRTLQLDTTEFGAFSAVYWADASTLVVQSDLYRVFAIDTATATARLVSDNTGSFRAVIS